MLNGAFDSSTSEKWRMRRGSGEGGVCVKEGVAGVVEEEDERSTLRSG